MLRKVTVRKKDRRNSTEVPTQERLPASNPESVWISEQSSVREYQRCGGGRRVIRKRIGSN